jgi:hypothetical protein
MFIVSDLSGVLSASWPTASALAHKRKDIKSQLILKFREHCKWYDSLGKRFQAELLRIYNTNLKVERAKGIEPTPDVIKHS